MALTPGTRLGAYEVVSALGAGGMGEVYRARDPKLNRDVALKVVPEALASGADRLARFKREAQALASLNHPNIVTIYSVEETDGFFFIAMELVEGHSLADILSTSGFAVGPLLKIAIPIVDAIVAAHQKGVTHRDLKPGNIMLSATDDRVKILDFGLAKLTQAQQELPGAAASPTVTLTGEGRVLGTVAYMSPEQAEGKPLDARSDLFSLGIVLYEMATGRRPFAGDTNLSILSSIIRDTPPSVTDLNPSLPRDLALIVRRALIKDPERRYQTAKDLRSDLEELKEALDSGALGVASTTPRLTSALRRYGTGAAAAAGAVVALAGGIYMVARRPARVPTFAASQAPPEVSLQTLQVTQLTTSGSALYPAVSPDGRFVAYIRTDGARTSLWVRQSAVDSNVQIVPAEPGVILVAPAVTPDGNFVDFVRRKRDEWPSLWRVSFLGGTPRQVIDNVFSGVGWSTDGKSLAFVRFDSRTSPTSSSLIVTDADGRRERVIATHYGDERFANTTAGRLNHPSWNDNGHLIALVGNRSAVQPFVIVVDAATGKEQVIPLPWSETPMQVAWLDSESLVVNGPSEQGGPWQLWKLSYPDGRLSRLTNDVGHYIAMSFTADRSVLATSRNDSRASIWVADGSGSDPEEVPVNSWIYGFIGWAGDRLLYETQSPGTPSLAIWGSEGQGETIVVKGVAAAVQPTGTSDGKTLVYAVTDPSDPGRQGLWKVDSDGSHQKRIVAGHATTPLVTPDDRSVVFLSQRSGAQTPWIVSIDGGTPSQIVDTFADACCVSVSPDSRSLLFSTTPTGVFMCELPSCDHRKAVTPKLPIASLRWAPDGRGVAYVDAGQSNVWVQPLDGTAPMQLTHFAADHRWISDFKWTHDGRHLAVSRITPANDIVLFKGLKR